MANFARTLHIVLLGIWLGASIFFIGFVERVTGVIESRHLAGEVITQALDLIEVYGIIAGPVILVSLFVGWVPLAVPLGTRVLGAMLMVGAVALSRYWVTPEMVEVKRQMGTRLEHMDPSHPLVEHFQTFDGVSSALMLLQLAACFLMLVAAVRSSPKRSFGGIEL